jgi:hypothetical protein
MASVVVLAACAGGPQRDSVEPMRLAHAPAQPAPVVATAPAPARAPGPLTRAEVDALVARGLGPLLARVRLSPVLDGGRFVGFRLDAAEDLGSWRASGADVRIGDVITQVNGIRIERPEQAMWAFQRLRIASAIDVDVLRDNARASIHSPILDGAAP